MKGKKNYLEAQKILDKLYSSKSSHSKKKVLYKKYLLYLRKAAYKGYGEAQYDLGQHYEDFNFFGSNPRYNPKKCFYWYGKACSNNIASACNNLATYYERGLSCKEDKIYALELYKKSSLLGSDLGRKNLRLLKKELNMQ